MPASILLAWFKVVFDLRNSMAIEYLTLILLYHMDIFQKIFVSSYVLVYLFYLLVAF